MAKYRVGQMVRIRKRPGDFVSCEACNKAYVGRVCTILHPLVDPAGFQRYEVDVPRDHSCSNHWTGTGNIHPLEDLLVPVNPPPEERTTWEEFIKLTGFDPRKEPAHVE